MEHMLQHANLSESARQFFIQVLNECPGVFRPREMFWQIKLLSRYSAERMFFDAALEKKQRELEVVLPIVQVSIVPPARSIPLSRWQSQGFEWPDARVVLTQVFLQQILNSTELFLDLGSRTDSFFLSEKRDFICWVPDSVGTRWHEPFRCELARLYLGWAFEQEKLIEVAVQAMHLAPVLNEITSALAHWREPVRCSLSDARIRFLKIFHKANRSGLHLHPNMLVWALYELEMIEVLSRLGIAPNLEYSADELCRSQSRIAN